MRTEELRDQILAAVAQHAVAAQESQYDRTVCITAVGAARSTVEAIAPDCASQDFGSRVLCALNSLHQTYNDTDGEYTNGRGVIGSLIADIEAAVRKAGPT